MPTLANQIRKMSEIDSVKEQLDELKTLGEKLALNNLRMITIKDRIMLMSSQVDSIRQLTEKELEKAMDRISAFTGLSHKLPQSFEGYQVVDESDPVDKLVGKYFVEKYAGVVISRISAQFYIVGDK